MAVLFIGAISVLIIFKDSIFVSNLRDAFDKVFSANRDEYVEVVDLNKADPLVGYKEEYDSALLVDDKLVEGSNGVPKKIDFSNIVISSVIFDVDGADEGKERIVIRNNGGMDIDLFGGSVQYVSSGGNFSTVKKKNFESGHKISAGGEFVIGANCHSESPCVGANMSWSEALNNSGGSVFIVSGREAVAGFSDSSIAARFDYTTN